MRAIDFETYLIGDKSIFPKPICLSSYNGTEAFLFRKDEMYEHLKQILPEETIIAHNAVFECGVIITHFSDLKDLVFKALNEGRIICTKINEQLYDILREKSIGKFSLANLVKVYFDEDISDSKTADAWRTRYEELENLDQWPQEAINYAINDSIYAYKINQLQKPVDYKLHVQSEVYLNLMGAAGIDIDTSRVETLKSEILDFLNPRYEFLIGLGYCVRKKGKVNKQIKKLQEYIETLDIQKDYTATGLIKVGAESLEKYGQQCEDKIINTFRELTIYEKALSAYVNRMTADKIYSQYSAVKNTGRTSSNGSKLFTSLNIQQMPRQVPNVSYDIRNCFIPPKGFDILSIDYAGLELCSTAHQLYKLYGYSSMRDTLNSGDTPVDMHSKLAARIKRVSYEEFIKNKDKETRQLAKPINLGFPGGIGYDTMRHILWKDGIKTRFEILHKEPRKTDLYYYLHSLSDPRMRITRLSKKEYALVIDELVKFKRDFLDLYPELEEFLKETHNKFLTGKHKFIKNEFDEWEKEPMYAYEVNGFKRDWCTYTALCNGYLMQTPSALGAKRAVINVMNKYYGHPDVQPIAFIHDEILFTIRKDRMDIVKDLCNIMIESMKEVLSSVRITVEASLSEQWQKADGFWTEKYWK